jgi:hypothetical protein
VLRFVEPMAQHTTRSFGFVFTVERNLWHPHRRAKVRQMVVDSLEQTARTRCHIALVLILFFALFASYQLKPGNGSTTEPSGNGDAAEPSPGKPEQDQTALPPGIDIDFTVDRCTISPSPSWPRVTVKCVGYPSVGAAITIH